MFLVRSVLAAALMLLAIPAMAQTGCVPNPNVTFPNNPAVNGCPMPAAALNISGVGTQTPQLYGAVCDGSTDDHVALQAAITALQGTGRGLFLPGKCATNTALTVSAPLEITGQNMGNRSGLNQYAGFVPLTANQTILAIGSGASGSRIHDFAIFAGPPGFSTSGSWITIAGAYDVHISRLFAQSPCGFVDLQSGNSDIIEENVVNNFANSGCIAIKIGSQSAGATTIGPRVLHNIVAASQSLRPEAGIAIFDVGGGSFVDNDVLYSNYGTKIVPGTNQIVQWSTFTSDQGGDTNVAADLLLDPQAASAQIESLVFTGSWSSNASGGPPLLMQNTGGGAINNVHFVGHRFYANGNNDAADINAGVNIEFDSAQFCLGSNVSSGKGASVGAAVTSASFRNSIFGNCNGAVTGAGTSATGTGIAQASASTRLAATNNNFLAASTPLSLPTNPSLDLIEHNQGLDDASASNVTSATTITLPPNKLIPITGTTTITTMNGWWPNRVAILMPLSSALNLNTGGNICNSATSTANVAIIATYSVGPNCWTLK